MYHDVFNKTPDESGFCSPGANFYKLSSTLFEGHVKKISKLIYDKRIKRENIVFTFDDGGVSAATIIAPILEKYGFWGYFFVATDMINKSGFVNESQIRTLIEHGHLVGSHSATHPENMLDLSANDSRKEWMDSVKRLEQVLERRIDLVSIPNGYFRNSDIKTLKELGIRKIYTSKIGQYEINDGIELVGRYAITSAHSSVYLEKLITNSFTRFLKLYKQKSLEVIKTLLGKKYMSIKKVIRAVQK